MNTQVTSDVSIEIEDHESRNADYTEKLERGICEIEEGKGITKTFEEGEKRFCSG